ncbi:interferon-stimulated 20 kDa exonuclease-like 2 [Ctenodactylus gundi]
MSALLLNLDFAECPPKKSLEGNAKHRNFVKRRRFLEQRGFLNKKNQYPNKTPKLHSEPPKKGETRRGDGTWKIPLRKKKTAASSSGSEQSRDEKATVSWLTPAPSKKTDSVVAKVDLLGEFQSALPKIKSHPACSLKKAPQKNRPQNSATQNSTQAPLESKCSGASWKPGKMVAVDCEMVGTGPKGHISSLARCSIVSYSGEVLYDEYILPPCPIVDYRTRWSGIRKKHMANATPFKIAQSQILKILAGKIVVGHAIHNDFKALQYFHPKSLTRDTSRIPLLNRKASCPENATMSLKTLTKKLLDWDIQAGKSGHSSVEDAQATMELYKLVEVEWEQHLAQNPPKEEQPGGSRRPKGSADERNDLSEKAGLRPERGEGAQLAATRPPPLPLSGAQLRRLRPSAPQAPPSALLRETAAPQTRPTRLTPSSKSAAERLVFGGGGLVRLYPSTVTSLCSSPGSAAFLYVHDCQQHRGPAPRRPHPEGREAAGRCLLRGQPHASKALSEAALRPGAVTPETLPALPGRPAFPHREDPRRAGTSPLHPNPRRSRRRPRGARAGRGESSSRKSRVK